MTLQSHWQRMKDAYNDGKGRGPVLSVLLHAMAAMLLLLSLPGLMPAADMADEEGIPVDLVTAEGAPGSPGQSQASPAAQPTPGEVRQEKPQDEPLPAVTKRQRRPSPPETGTDRESRKTHAAVGQPVARAHPKVAQSAGQSLLSGSGATVGPGTGGSFDVKDFLRAQIERHWEFDVARLGNADLTVSIHVLLDPDGTVRRADVVDDPRYLANPAFKSAADSARRAVLVASPLQFPPGKYEGFDDVTLDLNPREALQ